MKKAATQIKKSKFDRFIPGIVLSLIAVYTGIFSWVAYIKYASFSFQDIDLAVISQLFWNTIHGNIIVQEIGSATILNGGHVFLISIILGPVFAIAQSPLTLLFLQSLALGSGAWAVYLICRHLINPLAGLAFSICYLLYPALNYVNLFEFHPIAFSTPLLLFFFVFYQRRKWGLFLLFLFLALSCREDVSIPVIAFGIYALIIAFIDRRQGRGYEWRWGIIPLLAGILWFVFCVKFLQPHFKLPVMNTAGSRGMLGYYGWLGTSPLTIIENIFTHEQFSLLGKAKLTYLLHLLLPLGFTSLLSPSAFIMVLISLSEGLLSSRFTHFAIRYQYSSIITPYIFISAIYGLKNILRVKIFAKTEKIILLLLVVIAVISAVTIGPLVDLPSGMRGWKITAEDRIRERLVEEIPPGAPVIATFAFTPKLSMRPLLFYFYHVYTSSRRRDFIPNVKAAQKTANWALIDFNDWLTFYDFYTPGGDRDIYHFLEDGNWRMVETINSLVLFQKGNEAALGVVGIGESRGGYLPVNIQINTALRLLGYNLKSKEIRGSMAIGLDVLFECNQIIRQDLLFVARFDSRAEPGFSFQQAFFAPYRIYPSTRWKPKERIRQSCSILIPEDAPSGNYDLTMILMVSKGRRFSGNIIYKKPDAVLIPAPQGL